jgi:hypothetical protein
MILKAIALASVLGLLFGTLSILGCRRDGHTALSRIAVDGVTSYYVYSNVEKDSKAALPVIIFVGHPADSPERLFDFKDQFKEPVLLIWSGILGDFQDATLVDDQTMWHEKRQQFLVFMEKYKEHFSFDERRVYLTGFSGSGVYAWMLAYDRPGLYAGVVAMSAVSYPEQIQGNIGEGASLVTVVVRGRNDHMFPERLEQEIQTGRVIESLNPNSRFILKEDEGHKDVAKYWLEYLKYILQFSKAETISLDL